MEVFHGSAEGFQGSIGEGSAGSHRVAAFTGRKESQKPFLSAGAESKNLV